MPDLSQGREKDLAARSQPCADARERSPEAQHSGGKERPILFSGPMVRALLDGRKTQTRRTIKPQPVSSPVNGPLISFNHGIPEYSFGLADRDARGLKWWRCPYGVPGDLLWVRETCGWDWFDDGNSRAWKRPVYRADPGAVPMDNGCEMPWRPSIHMPRWASRLTLRITEVRVERLQDISRDDARAEGLHEWAYQDCDGDPRLDGQLCEAWGWHWQMPPSEYEGFGSPIAAYRDLWNHINGPGSWDANPWVWAVSFEVVRGPRS